MIEIEYVGIKDVQEILEYAKAVMSRGHYINVSIANVGELALVSVGITLGGFDEKKGYDYSYTFYMSDDEGEVDIMNDCKKELIKLIDEGTPKENGYTYCPYCGEKIKDVK